MSFKIKTVPNFEREVKKIFKKHRGIKSDLLKLVNDLEVNPELGTHLGQNIYKIRLSISGTNKGKSGGARVITYVIVIDKIVYLSEIYLKSDHSTVNIQDVIQRLKDAGIFDS
ncbi:type II toxin-antitoxin system RelE/ParE family toxin [Pedobacter sp. MR2016-19]|uniref:type II toxin-antitoxin system RelE/ParE family toxin n=1 Tax=Pedobacter sp. MR2016-19 TaxID=2780089 RepID=UPI0018771EF6|nr:type II toxin-antitoxin system RelE/ParE family toxin [Pedobacter sp. MR2016-19]MBE5320275.1 type II toxin-antitoxin system RelE/ParE family toxin [Pedobacter sp. MR2016-19]